MRHSHANSFYLSIRLRRRAMRRQQFEAAYRATGKRCDVAKSCVRFRKLDDLPLALIGASIAAFNVDQFIARAEKAPPAQGQAGLS